MPAISPGNRLFGVVSVYGLLILCGIISALVLSFSEEKRRKLPKDTVVDLACIMIPAGILCARLYYVAFTWENYRTNLLSVLYIWEGGLAIYGGLIGGALTALLFSRKRHINPLKLFDTIVIGVPLAQAIGRWGNYFNMEAFGPVIVSENLQFFPFGVLIPEAGAYVWHYATFFYESFWNLIVFAFLFFTRKKQKDGGVIIWYILLYGCGRMIIEGLRTDSLMAGDGLRASQLLSCGLILAAVAFLYARSSKTKRIPSPELICMAVLAAGCGFVLGKNREPFVGYGIASVILVSFLVVSCASSISKRKNLFAAVCTAMVVLMNIWCYASDCWGITDEILYPIAACSILSISGITAGAVAACRDR